MTVKKEIKLEGRSKDNRQTEIQRENDREEREREREREREKLMVSQ